MFIVVGTYYYCGNITYFKGMYEETGAEEKCNVGDKTIWKYSFLPLFKKCKFFFAFHK